MPIQTDLKDLWVPIGLLLGFQVTLFKWRLEQEAAVGDQGDTPWLVPADYVSIVGMLFFVIGVILAPVSGYDSLKWPVGRLALAHYLSSDKRLDWQDIISSSIAAKRVSLFGFLLRRRSCSRLGYLRGSSIHSWRYVRGAA